MPVRRVGCLRTVGGYSSLVLVRRSVVRLLLPVAGCAILVTACDSHATVPVQGVVVKTVGRPCDLLSAAFPGVAHRVVTFTDEAGAVIGRVVTGAQRARGNRHGGCDLTSGYRIALPLRHSYAAQVSSTVEVVAPTPSVDYDTLAERNWRFDVRIPPAA